MKLAKPIIVLTVICIITSALLGFTYDLTADKIDAVNKAASDAAMAQVVPGAQTFEEIEIEGVTGLISAAKEASGLGYAFKVQDKGFGGAFVTMVGIGPDGKLTGAKLLDNNETPGLGSKTGQPKFLDQFPGKDRSLEGVQTITGATISSKAFLRCIDVAYQAFEKVGEGAK